MNKLKIAILLILCIAVISYAIPVINGASGTVTHKASITISGSGFGAKANAAPIRYDNFESGTLGQRLKTEAEGGWTTCNSKATYSNSKVRFAGTQSCRQDFTNGNYNCYIQLSAFTGNSNLLCSSNKATIPSGTKSMYFSGWYYITTSGAKSRNVKLLNYGSGGGDGWQTRIDQYPTTNSGHMYAYSGSCNTASSTAVQDWGISGSLYENAWHRLEGWLDLGTPNGNNGLRTAWIDGKKWCEIKGTFTTDECSIGYQLVGHYFATDEGTPQPSAERWWDEMYVDVTCARIEIGNAPSFTSCTHREIQIPTAWSDGSITMTVNQATFNNSDGAFLYVIDKDGNVNAQGYPVVFGTTKIKSIRMVEYGRNGIENVSVYDVMGKRVSQNLTSPTSTALSAGLTPLPTGEGNLLRSRVRSNMESGIYFTIINENGKQSIKRFVMMK